MKNKKFRDDREKRLEDIRERRRESKRRREGKMNWSDGNAL
jgi:hypothetical protein